MHGICPRLPLATAIAALLQHTFALKCVGCRTALLTEWVIFGSDHLFLFLLNFSQISASFSLFGHHSRGFAGAT